MKQSKYESKKAKLKAIQNEWSKRLTLIRKGLYTGKLQYGEMVSYYLDARHKSRKFRGWE